MRECGPVAGQAEFFVGERLFPHGDASDPGARRGEHGTVFAVVPAAADAEETVSRRRSDRLHVGAFGFAAVNNFTGCVVSYRQRQHFSGREAQDAFIPLARLEFRSVFAEDGPDGVAIPGGNLSGGLVAVKFIRIF